MISVKEQVNNLTESNWHYTEDAWNRYSQNRRGMRGWFRRCVLGALTLSWTIMTPDERSPGHRLYSFYLTLFSHCSKTLLPFIVQMMVPKIQKWYTLDRARSIWAVICLRTRTQRLTLLFELIFFLILMYSSLTRL